VDEAVPIDVATLVAEHYAAVYRYAYRLCGSVADAEDLTQQVFLNAQRKLDQLRGAEAARAWLYAILRNCFLASRRPSAMLGPGHELRWDELPEDAPAPQAVDGELLQKALDALPDDYRLILLMYYFEDYSYREIAEHLALPIGTVMSRLSRAKSTLRGGLWGPKLKEMFAAETKK
jgi:RNA polymerase sigma-70 factor (ECF subfamily)